MATTATRQDINSSSTAHTPLPSLTVYSVTQETIYTSGDRHDQGKIVWDVLATDPTSPDQLPNQVATTYSIHQAKHLAATLNSYEAQQHEIERLQSTISTLENELQEARRANTKMTRHKKENR